ncbi:hypothetical protein ACFSQE_00080 [Vogesella fluminis]|uniref:hypothetical protein n=1 Tax=Vogesella fluminis TaxID=1069161 RepID=UPI00362D1233
MMYVVRLLGGCLLCLGLLPLAVAGPVLLDDASQFALHSQHTGQTYRIYLSVPVVPPPAGGYPVLYALDGDYNFAQFHRDNPREAGVFERLRQHARRCRSRVWWWASVMAVRLHRRWICVRRITPRR